MEERSVSCSQHTAPQPPHWTHSAMKWDPPLAGGLERRIVPEQVFADRRLQRPKQEPASGSPVVVQFPVRPLRRDR